MSTVDRKQQIIEEATTLFSEEGFDKVSIRKLANACGFSEPALYRHFKSKDDIYCAVLDALKDKMDCEKLFAGLVSEDDVEVILQAPSDENLHFTDIRRGCPERKHRYDGHAPPAPWCTTCHGCGRSMR